MSRTKKVIFEGNSQNSLLFLPWLTELVLETLSDTGAFCLNNISVEDMTLFLLKQTYMSLLFISGTMNVFCQAGSDQQAQQLTHLAKVQNPL